MISICEYCGAILTDPAVTVDHYDSRGRFGSPCDMRQRRMGVETNARTVTLLRHKRVPPHRANGRGLTPTTEVDVMLDDTRPACLLPRFEAC